MKIQGRVIEFRKDGKGIKLDTTGEMYSVFNPQMLNGINTGDVVEFDFKEGKTINNMTGRPYLNITGKVTNLSSNVVTTQPVSPYPTTIAVPQYAKVPEKVGEPVLSTSRCIIRQNALTAAVNFCLGTVPMQSDITSVKQVIEVAREFEAYTSGDADLEEVKQELGEESE